MPEDDQKAVRWLESAAKQGNDKAQCMMGTLCFEGRGIEKNDEEAARWFQLASDQGNSTAQGSLG